MPARSRPRVRSVAIQPPARAGGSPQLGAAHRGAAKPYLPIAVQSVFISSRMEELAIERRAAFRAAYESNLVPLLFETEPAQTDLKGQLDNLVDKADLFVGVYYRSFGRAYSELYGMTPIEYELLRFLTLWRVRYQHWNRARPRDGQEVPASGSKHATTASETATKEAEVYGTRSERETVDLLLGQFGDEPCRYAFLQTVQACSVMTDESFRAYCEARRKASLDVDSIRYARAVMNCRMCLFCRTDNDEFSVSYKLARFLGPQGARWRKEFSAQVIGEAVPEPGQRGPGHEPHPDDETGLMGKTSMRYDEPHVHLYVEMKRALREATSAKFLEVRSTKPEGEARDRFTLHLEVQDEVGVLERILFIYFQRGLNISDLSVMSRPDERAHVRIEAHPFYTIDTDPGIASGLQEEVRQDLFRVLRDVPRDRNARALQAALLEVTPRAALERPSKCRPKLLHRISAKPWKDFQPCGEKVPVPDVVGLAQDCAVLGADVPGILLSIARVVKDLEFSIRALHFSSARETTERAMGDYRGSFLATKLLTCPKVRKEAGDKESHEKKEAQLLGYRLQNLLGVEWASCAQWSPTESGSVWKPASRTARPGKNSRSRARS